MNQYIMLKIKTEKDFMFIGHWEIHVPIIVVIVLVCFMMDQLNINQLM